MDSGCRHSLFSRGNEFLGTTYPIMGGAMTWLSERNLVSSEIYPTKQSIRNYLRSKGLDHEFTKIQSVVYGERILEAKIADGFKEFLNKIYSKFDIYIVSHKTQFPIKGKKYDLRVAAINFLKTNSLIGNDDCLINEKNIFLKVLKKIKLKE